ncbi:HNH endonuclease family protein [Kitasatospora sp. NPDC088783]|uniref:HNH endonuclease family protein n=1 Tax=Kitasatospora sp. NPDC088783 TaxID=3364077 RepID=UPI003824066A
MRTSSLLARRATAVGGAALTAVLLASCASVAPGSAGGDAQPPSGGGAGAGGWPGPATSATSQARTELAALQVAPQHAMSGYSRDRFPLWAPQGGNCDTREAVLKRDGKNVATDGQCKATSGSWTSPYDGQAVTDASKLDIDHVVPLAAAWRAGADTWSDEQRKALANDLTRPQLQAVSASSNRGKGDQGPDQWKPPLKEAWCSYAKAWTDVKAFYKLTVTDAEKSALGQMIDTCGA